MADFQFFLSEGMLFMEGTAMIISLLFYRQVKDQYWRYFVFYLTFIFLCEAFGKWGGNLISFDKSEYYNYFVIPVQFLFLYWLYAVKSLNKKNLFFILSSVYLLSFIPNELFFEKRKIIFSFNYTFGSFLLMILVIMEYYKQINSANILYFNQNRMFYINLGVTLFYIGTLPFWTFYFLLLEHMDIWNIYFIYFLISGIIMYLLFSISFIWGKQSYT